jgi:hypothetical protein
MVSADRIDVSSTPERRGMIDELISGSSLVSRPRA